MVQALEKDGSHLKTMGRVLDLVSSREAEQRARVGLLEREIGVVARAEVRRRKRAEALEAAYENEARADVVKALRVQLDEALGDLDGAETARQAAIDALSAFRAVEPKGAFEMMLS